LSNCLRIIAGSLKGRRLKPPTWDGVRPTSDKLRETLFNILAPRIAGANVMDGYAGTGALGIEALSRGAARVTFVDADRRAQALIADNLALCGVTGGYAIIRATVAVAIDDLGATPADPFDIILLDPPYDDPQVDAVIAAGGDVLAAGGLLVFEHARRRTAPEAAGRLVRVRQVASGDSMLSFYSCPP
jgi:16S rRNA (guanine(966)-N(2))-methyltransferase RsmD